MLTAMRHSVNRSLTTIEAHPLLYICWGVFLLFLCAQISIPLEPVPITLQTFGVMLVGVTFPRKIAVQSILSYLTMGAIGFPVFAGFKSGYAVFLSPTGGYLIGFLLGIILMTYIAAKQSNPWGVFSMTINCLVGTIAIYICGMLGLTRFMPVSQVVQAGFLPFILPGIVKIALLAVSIKYLRGGLLDNK